MPIKISKNRIDVGSLKFTGLREPQAATEAATQAYVNLPRIGSTTSASSITPTASSYDMYVVTALATGLTIGSPGVGNDGQKLIIRIKVTSGIAQSISYSNIFRASSDLALPTSLLVTKTAYMGFMYNAADVKWDLIAVLENF